MVSTSPPTDPVREFGSIVALVGFLGLVGVIYFLYKRPEYYSEDAMFLAGGSILAFALIGVAALWGRSVRSRTKRSLPPPGLRIAAFQFATLLVSGLWILNVVGWLFEVGYGLQWIASNPKALGPSFQKAIVLGVLVFGLVLFSIRRRFRSSYGVLEVLVGAVIAQAQAIDVVSTNHSIDSRFMLTMLTAGAYLVVRGLDNVDQGRKATPNDPVARMLNWLYASDSSTN